jgi:hypothetical protein
MTTNETQPAAADASVERSARPCACPARDALDAVLCASFKRRVAVEQALLDMAAGKLPMPDATKLRELAQHLGTPESPARVQIQYDRLAMPRRKKDALQRRYDHLLTSQGRNSHIDAEISALDWVLHRATA